MRIHLQNPDNDPLFDFSRAMWEAAAARSPDIGLGHDVSIGVTPADLRRRHARCRGIGLRCQRHQGAVPLPRPASEADLPDQRRPQPTGAVRLAAARRGADEQPRRACRESRRVRADGDPDAGQPRPGHGDQPAERQVAQALGLGARRSSRDRRRSRHAGRRDGDTGGAVRHARHRRAGASGAASGLRAGPRHRKHRGGAAGHRLPRPRLPADRGDTRADEPEPAGMPALRRRRGEHRPRRTARPGCAVRPA